MFILNLSHSDCCVCENNIKHDNCVKIKFVDFIMTHTVNKECHHEIGYILLIVI